MESCNYDTHGCTRVYDRLYHSRRNDRDTDCECDRAIRSVKSVWPLHSLQWIRYCCATGNCDSVLCCAWLRCLCGSTVDWFIHVSRQSSDVSPVACAVFADRCHESYSRALRRHSCSQGRTTATGSSCTAIQLNQRQRMTMIIDAINVRITCFCGK